MTKGSGSLQGPFVCYEVPQTFGDQVFADEVLPRLGRLGVRTAHNEDRVLIN